MKKLAIASAAMGGAALVAFGASGTFAAFTDADQVTSTAGAGTLVLDATSRSATAPAEALDLNPGESASYAYWVKNAGTLPGTLDVAATVTDLEGGCASESELAADPTCDAANDRGEFSSAASLTVASAPSVQSAEACTITATQASPVTLPLKNANGGTIKDVPAQPNQAACFILTIKLPKAETGNAVQGDQASLAVDFVLEQL